jgi:hypothetical protein
MKNSGFKDGDDVNPGVIKKAYRKLAKKFHPDANKDMEIKVETIINPLMLKRWEDIMKICGMETRVELTNNGIALLSWAVEKILAGGTLAAIDESVSVYHEFLLDPLINAREWTKFIGKVGDEHNNITSDGDIILIPEDDANKTLYISQKDVCIMQNSKGEENIYIRKKCFL